MRAWCVAARTGLAVTEPGTVLPERMERHLAACLRCQAERARQRRLQRHMAALRYRVAPAPGGYGRPSVAGRWVAVTPSRVDPHDRRSAAALAGVAALAAGGALYAVWRVAHRPA